MIMMIITVHWPSGSAQACQWWTQTAPAAAAGAAPPGPGIRVTGTETWHPGRDQRCGYCRGGGRSRFTNSESSTVRDRRRRDSVES